MIEPDQRMAGIAARFAVRLTEERAFWAVMSARSDTGIIIDRAHKLAGLAGMVGAPEVGAAALRLEEAVRAGGQFNEELCDLLGAIERALS